MGEPTDQDISRSSKVECCILKQVTAINNRLACNTAISFGCTDINTSTGYVITQPGVYCLKEECIFRPGDSASRAVISTTAITVNSSDVIINLNGHHLSQGNTVPGALGINIIPGHKNITVMNGTIEKFTNVAIVSSPTPDATLSELLFNDLTLIDNGNETKDPNFNFASGIDFEGTDVDSLSNVIINNCRINRSFGEGVAIFGASKLIINNTQTNDTFVPDLGGDGDNFFAVGYDIEICDNVVMLNSTANGTQHLDPLAPDIDCLGTFFSNNTACFIKDCQFNDVFAESSALMGNIFSNTRDAILLNCQFNDVTGGSGSAIVNGLHASDSPDQTTNANGVKFVNCQFNRITRALGDAPGATVAGVQIVTEQNLVFENCQVCSISGPSVPGGAVSVITSGFAVGVNAQDPTPPFADALNVTFTNCVASQIAGDGNVFGINLRNVPQSHTGAQAQFRNFVLNNCVVTDVSSTSATNQVGGIASTLNRVTPVAPNPVLQNVFIKNCRVSDVRGGSAAQSAGIYLEAAKEPVLQNNSVTSCQNGILLIGSNALFPNNFFQLALSPADAAAGNFIDLTSVPAGSPVQAFNNTTEANSINVTVSPSTVSTQISTIQSPTNLNTLNWKTGDAILYNPTSTGTAIGGLTNNTTYFLIVFSPGFTENAVVQANEVNQCSVAGYREIRTVQAGQPLNTPFTTSAWVNNLAFNNGTPASFAANYMVQVAAGVQPPVLDGQISTVTYTPLNPATYFANLHNLSLIP